MDNPLVDVLGGIRIVVEGLGEEIAVRVDASLRFSRRAAREDGESDIVCSFHILMIHAGCQPRNDFVNMNAPTVLQVFTIKTHPTLMLLRVPRAINQDLWNSLLAVSEIKQTCHVCVLNHQHLRIQSCEDVSRVVAATAVDWDVDHADFGGCPEEQGPFR